MTLGVLAMLELVGRLLLRALVLHEQGQLGSEDGLKEHLAIEQLSCGDVDAQDQFVAKHGLEQGVPDCRMNDFRSFAAQARTDRGIGVMTEAVDRLLIAGQIQKRGHVGLGTPVGMSLGQPAQDQLSRREVLLDTVGAAIEPRTFTRIVSV